MNKFKKESASRLLDLITQIYRLLVQWFAVYRLLRVLGRFSAYHLCAEPHGGYRLLQFALVTPSKFTKTLMSQDDQSGRTLSRPPTFVSAVRRRDDQLVSTGQLVQLLGILLPVRANSFPGVRWKCDATCLCYRL